MIQPFSTEGDTSPARAASSRTGRRRERLGYVIALLSGTAAVDALFIPAVGPGMGSVLFLAVMVSAWYGGLRPGLLATAAVAVELLAILFLSGAKQAPYHYVGLTLFVAGGVLVTVLVEALHAARRHAEESRRRLAAVLSSIGDAVIATDAHGRVSFTNAVAQALTGWGPGEAEGRPLGDVFRTASDSDGSRPGNPVERVIRDGVVVENDPAALLARDGTEHPIEASAAPVRDGGGVEGVVLVFRDVAERKRAEAERERLLAALRENDRLKDEFLAMLAHELRNPLAAIGNALALTAPAELGGVDDWAGGVLRRQVRHLARLVDDLLDVSRITRGKVELKPERLDAAAALAGAAEAVGPLVRERNHELVCDFPAGELWLDADPVRLEQVVLNLLTNAARYTERGGRIALAARREGAEVVVRVRDSGFGLAPGLLPRIFDLFTQGDRSLARSEGGLGIGLTVARGLVEQHGGTIAAHSEGPGLGSEFVVRLPAADGPPAPAPGAPPPAVPERPAERGEGAADRAGARGRRVLVVDDNVDTARGLAKLLRLLGHEVEAVHSGPEALAAARAQRPDFVLLDIGLPGMDGYEVARRLRGDECAAEAVIIAVTGYGREEDRRRSRAAGFDHHFVKPVDPDALISLLDACTAGPG